MSKNPIEYLKHILDECHYLQEIIDSGLTKDDLLKDETLKRAVVRSLEIIGEATKKIPADIKAKWDSVSIFRNFNNLKLKYNLVISKELYLFQNLSSFSLEFAA